MYNIIYHNVKSKKGNNMKQNIKKSVAVLLASIIKIDHKNLAKETPIFCKLMNMDFDCDNIEAEEILKEVLNEDYSIQEHLNIINNTLKDDPICKMHILEQLNQIIYSDTIKINDYIVFDKIKNSLFSPHIEKIKTQN